MGKKRSVALCIILVIFTFGIYGIYWMIVLNNEMLHELQEEGTSGGLVFLFSILTLGIYGLYWSYQMGRRVDRLSYLCGRYSDHSCWLYLLLDLLRLKIIVYAVIQNELNHYYVDGFARY